jgi:hypothetical protein
MYENCPKRYFHQRIEKSVVDPGGEASKHGERVHKVLEDYIKDDAPLDHSNKKFAPMLDALKQGPGTKHAELEMTLSDTFKPTGWFEPDAWLRSKLDYVAINGKNAVVLDWKTGKRRPDPFQLEVFALQVFVHYPDVDKVYSSFVWLPDEKTDTVIYYRSQMPELWHEIMSRVKRIEDSATSGTWQAKPSGLCGWCPCKSFCEFSAARR